MIQNRQSLATTPDRAVALDCLAAAIAAADPETATESAVSLDGETLCVGDARYDRTEFSDILVVGGGKAAGGVVRALESVLGAHITAGHIVVTDAADTELVRATVGDHPLPSDRNVAATAEILETIDAGTGRNSKSEPLSTIGGSFGGVVREQLRMRRKSSPRTSRTTITSRSSTGGSTF